MNYLRASFCALALAICFGGASLPAIAQSMPSCPGDTVVWENTSTKVYHEQGDKYFGKTMHGTYACKADADKAGFHLAGSKSKGGSTSDTSTTSTAPSPSPTPGGKHHRHHKGSAALPSPTPMAT
jgi:hypothetical protein